MMTKTTVVSLFALSLLVLGGVGYAAFTSSVTGTAYFTAGTLTLGVLGPAYGTSNTPAGGDAVAPTCTFTPSSDSGPPGSATFTLTASNLYPGDNGCDFAVAIYNSGSLPATSFTVSYLINPGGTDTCRNIATSGCYFLNDFLGSTPATAEAPASFLNNYLGPGASYLPGSDTPVGSGPMSVTVQPGGTILYTGYLNMWYCSAVNWISPYTCSNAQGSTASVLVTITGSVGADTGT